MIKLGIELVDKSEIEIKEFISIYFAQNKKHEKELFKKIKSWNLYLAYNYESPRNIPKNDGNLYLFKNKDKYIISKVTYDNNNSYIEFEEIDLMQFYIIAVERGKLFENSPTDKQLDRIKDLIYQYFLTLE